MTGSSLRSPRHSVLLSRLEPSLAATFSVLLNDRLNDAHKHAARRTRSTDRQHPERRRNLTRPGLRSLAETGEPARVAGHQPRTIIAQPQHSEPAPPHFRPSVTVRPDRADLRDNSDRYRIDTTLSWGPPTLNTLRRDGMTAFVHG